MSWSREQVTMLIEVYKNHPCLYVVKSPQYKNKHARNAALTDICSKLEAVKAGVTIADVKNKFAALRQNFLVEYRKHENSMKSGSGTDQVNANLHCNKSYSSKNVCFKVYIPTIWYYDLMLFVLEHSIAKTAIYDSIPKPLSPSLSSDSNIESLEFTDISQLEVVYEDEPDDSQTEEEPVNGGASNVHVIEQTPQTSRPQSQLKRKKGNEIDYLADASRAINEIANAVARKKPDVSTIKADRIDVFLKYIEPKLRRIKNDDLLDKIESDIVHIISKNFK
ncbi:uncharacterized protein LOC116176413 isoform X1 [Photinus pyralis]|uniref:uncharacterized protein LOC116159119 isoform X1 n=1 Tax=Photinus pyralis TaxID=7054 RepID=UPI0012673C45|nr:uncharacterized protein LOC116159119 isoform X1 [Photinus pyralis]XP_031340378.1 uncharacterized protein LOC116168342 isoform X1 [Photinus pyralis]XP_031341054.1 uncharacterized protein LOC116168342 isoform X1 [Photinus pyralis]XP_031341460.1 uncharacterized protein LOC116169492 isoform X1 [Photinus pyralis]XP_031349213.1 uncharacterized protein LOC116175215 isoform X1 [Photinus pyralis]XP_031349215.1 uncharacterized protein LOC116175215 isoform X1 [Photinus pyralis]XP_031350816.1 uncharac